jgi:hypothetical protein
VAKPIGGPVAPNINGAAAYSPVFGNLPRVVADRSIVPSNREPDHVAPDAAINRAIGTFVALAHRPILRRPSQPLTSLPENEAKNVAIALRGTPLQARRLRSEIPLRAFGSVTVRKRKQRKEKGNSKS